MRPLSASELLDAWERSLAEPPLRRALTLLAAACPDTSADELAEESVGRRDHRLLTLREQTFGGRLVSLATCPSCDEQVESSFDVEEIRTADSGEGVQEPFTFTVSGVDVTCRLLNSLDLAALAGVQDLEEARRRLLERCLLAALGPDGEEISLSQLADETLAAVADAMGRTDPQADVGLALTCPACGHAWTAAFDVASFLWSEVDAWARTVLREVHALACAYGWREADVLALSPWRRRAYLELTGR